tara:strand:+ start:30236 stop:31210 length:975 start_codon:yes stop_codon:yes gene_type:complete
MSLLELNAIDTRDMSKVRHASTDELKQKREMLQRERMNLRFQRATGQLENTARIKDVRRSLARLESEFTRRRLEGAKSSKQKKSLTYKQAARVSRESPNRDLQQSQALKEGSDPPSLVHKLLGIIMAMLDTPPINAAKIATELGIPKELKTISRLLKGEKVNRSTTRVARRVSALVAPSLIAQPRAQIESALQLLAITSFYETIIPEEDRKSLPRRLQRILSLYEIPCFVTTEVEDIGGKRVLRLYVSSFLDEFIGVGSPTPINSVPGTVRIVIFSGLDGKLPKKVAEFEVDPRTPLTELVQLSGDDTVFVSVNGDTCSLDVAA